MKNSAYILLTLLALLFACTKTELCEEGDHPHRAGVRFAYDWSTVNSDPRVSFHGTMPSTEKDTVMLTIVKRIIGTEITGCVFNVIKNKGYYLTNAPAAPVLPTDDGSTDDSASGGSPAGDDDTDDTTPTTDGDDSGTPATDGDGGTDGDPASGGSPAGDGDGTDTGTDGGTDSGSGGASARAGETPVPATAQEVFDVDLFKIRPGTFKMVTVNRDTTEFDYTELLRYLEYGVEDGTTLHELCMEYKRYGYGSPKLRHQVPGWADYNIYGGADNFLQPDLPPIYYDSIAPCDIDRNSEQVFTFKPIQLTQNIDIRFHIRKEGHAGKGDAPSFAIENVYAEISGIPYRLNLSSDVFDIKNTAKMRFTCKLENGNGNEITDALDNNYLLCHGNIDVLSLVNAPNDEVTTGPGILQLMIKVKDRQKMLRARVNLYYAIDRAKLYKATEDGKWAVRRKDHGVLEIDTDLIINDDATITQDEDGGLDKWVEVGRDEIIVDA